MGARRKKRKLEQGERRRVTRERRRKVAELLAAGHSIAAVATELGCGEDVVRRHARALREAARRRVVAEWSSETAAATADLIEAVDDALQKTRAAQLVVERASSDYRKLLWLEVYTLRQLADLRRELARNAAAARRDGDLDEFGEEIEHWTTLTDEELLEKAAEIGVDVTAFADALRRTKAGIGIETPRAPATTEERREGTADGYDRSPAHFFEPPCSEDIGEGNTGGEGSRASGETSSDAPPVREPSMHAELLAKCTPDNDEENWPRGAVSRILRQ